MPYLNRYVFACMWLAWLAYWLLSSRRTKASLRQESPWSHFAHIGPLLLAAWLLARPDSGVAGLDLRFFSSPLELFWPGAALCALGLGFAVWARRHIGHNWSSTVSVKQQHELVVSGPYALVRHPIYSGLLLAVLGSALARAEWRGLLALLLVWLALWRKWRLEECWMEQTFGTAYGAYRRRVPALLPFLH
jgi:protein-S-isoprenylcysteine O-methyltransferase Ste14